MNKNIRKLEEELEESLRAFESGNGFGNPDERKNSEQRAFYSFARLYSAQRRRFEFTSSVINWIILPCVVIQTLVALCDFFGWFTN